MANQNMREQLALSLSNDVLTGALVQKKKAGYQFGFHIHTSCCYGLLHSFKYIQICPSLKITE